MMISHINVTDLTIIAENGVLPSLGRHFVVGPLAPQQNASRH